MVVDGDLMSKKTKNPRIKRSHKDVKSNIVVFKLMVRNNIC